jgi:hypothetical protein
MISTLNSTPYSVTSTSLHESAMTRRRGWNSTGIPMSAFSSPMLIPAAKPSIWASTPMAWFSRGIRERSRKQTRANISSRRSRSSRLQRSHFPVSPPRKPLRWRLGRTAPPRLRLIPRCSARWRTLPLRFRATWQRPDSMMEFPARGWKSTLSPQRMARDSGWNFLFPEHVRRRT